MRSVQQLFRLGRSLRTALDLVPSSASSPLSSSSSPLLASAAFPAAGVLGSACGLATTSYGQPAHHTHPELLGKDEITVGITAAEYRERRQRLTDALPPGSVVVLSAGDVKYMAGIVPYPYRPDPDFAYLTGVLQHSVVAVLQAGASQGEGSRFILFIAPPSPERDRWDGKLLDKDAAREVFKADEVYYSSELVPKVAQLCASALSETSGCLFLDSDRLPPALLTTIHAATTRTSLARSDRAPPPNPEHLQAAQRAELRLLRRVQELRPLLHAMRSVKSGAEAERMRRAAQLAAAGVGACMQASGPGRGEWELAALFEYRCKVAGAQRMAYPPVVASGPDAFYTHYGRNDKVLQEGQLLLMDAGCELHGYVSDVTRTWPINGRFSGPQRDVYDGVLEVHQRCVQACEEGSSIRDLHSLSTRLMSQVIRDLGLCGAASLQDISMTHYKQFYWHSVGHYLGGDVHDTPSLSHSKTLVPGNVITIEPGLYIPDEERYGRFRGIGVRIEDDVLVLAGGGCDVLSKDVPVDREEIEQLMRDAA